MPTLKAQTRNEFGSRRMARLRKSGHVPGILYGHGQENVPVTLATHAIELAVLHGERLLELDLDGRTENALLKEVQYDTFGHEVLHVDLARVDLHERVQVTVPVTLRGTPAGVNEGGMLQQTMAEVNIECVVTAIPEEIEASVTELKIGETLQAGQLELPAGATLLDEPDSAVCSVTYVSEEEVEEVEAGAEAAAAEPEVIGEGEAGEGEGAAGEEGAEGGGS